MNASTTASTNKPTVIITNKIPANLQKSATLIPVGHNAQPGRGSLGHWQEVKRYVAPGCMMCGGEQQFAECNGKAGIWCDRCRFFSQTED